MCRFLFVLTFLHSPRCIRLFVSNFNCMNFLSTVTLESSRAMADLTFTYKCLHGLIDISPESIGLHLQGGNTHGAGLHLAVPRATTSRVKSYFKYRLPILWNALPLTLLSSTSLNSFRRGLLC